MKPHNKKASKVETTTDMLSRSYTTWNVEDCFTFLALSEPQQKKLPGFKTPQPARIAVLGRLRELIGAGGASFQIPSATNLSLAATTILSQDQDLLVTELVNTLMHRLALHAPRVNRVRLLQRGFTNADLREKLDSVNRALSGEPLTSTPKRNKSISKRRPKNNNNNNNKEPSEDDDDLEDEEPNEEYEEETNDNNEGEKHENIIQVPGLATIPPFIQDIQRQQEQAIASNNHIAKLPSPAQHIPPPESDPILANLKRLRNTDIPGKRQASSSSSFSLSQSSRPQEAHSNDSIEGSSHPPTTSASVASNSSSPSAAPVASHWTPQVRTVQWTAITRAASNQTPPETSLSSSPEPQYLMDMTESNVK